MGKKNLFLCVAGKAVATISEGIYGLTREKGIPLHQIRILTTKRGRDKISSEFPQVFQRLKKDYPDSIKDLSFELPRDVSVCKDNKGRELEDILE